MISICVAKLIDTNVLVYPVESVVRLALYASAAFGLSWFDAHLWAYAEHYGCSKTAHMVISQQSRFL
jgi:predicted nucleic acid-binding protein